MALTIRHAAVAGRFYPRDPDDLRADLQSYLLPRQESLRPWAAWCRMQVMSTRGSWPGRSLPKWIYHGVAFSCVQITLVWDLRFPL